MKNFWPHIEKTDGCWLWTASCNDRGYGQVWDARKKTVRGAHRVAWELANDAPAPKGMVVRHTCDNRKCVNPDHLLLGTHAENSADMVQRGRQVSLRGEESPNAKLTVAQVLEIRSLSLPRAEIAAEFGVTKQHVGRILRREKWTHV